MKSPLKQDSRTDRVEKHLIKHGTISKSQAEALGVWTKGTLATIIHRLRHTRHLNIVALDRREAQWNENKDPETGDLWYWPAEQGTHAEGADFLNIAYDKAPGTGEVVILR